MSDIDRWLGALGLAQFCELFRENLIDDEVLPDLTDTDLEKLGLPLGARKKILKAIAARDFGDDAGGEPAAGDEAAPRAPASSGERRQLTVLFCDLVGSTELSRRLDPEDMGGVMRAYHGRTTEVIRRWGGHVAKYLGDGVLAYFGWPQAHEDDPERAVRAGLALFEAIAELDDGTGKKLAVRVGIATGPVVVGELIGEGPSQEQAVVGETPNLAARLQALAAPGAVVIAASTRRLVGGLFELGDLGPQRLKGFAEPLTAWRVEREAETESRFEATRGLRLTPLVGRAHELGLLLDRWSRAKDGEGQVVLLSGEAGIGKSRIVRALRERLADGPHMPLFHYCSPHHVNSVLYPVINLLERAAGFERGDRPDSKLSKLEALLALGTDRLDETVPLVAALLAVPVGEKYGSLNLTPQRQKQRTLEVLIDQVAGLAAKQPVLAIYEDVHWIDPTTLEALDLLVQRVQQLPVLVLITYRPEFNAPWSGHAHVMQFSLTRLTRGHGTAIVERIAGGKALPADVLEQILAKTDGVPLFVEELTKVVLESGLLTDSGDHYGLVGTLPPMAIPTTLHDSLMARLDRLAPVKEVAQIAAVIGREFSYDLLAAAAGESDATLASALDQLVASGLVFRHGNPPQATFSFKHALVQDTAYQSLLKTKRRQLHARIADVLETSFPDVVDLQPELLAHHCAQAGLIDKAIGSWQLAGRRANECSAPVEAAAHFNKALDLLAQLPESAERADRELQLRLDLAPALIATGGYRGPGVEDTYRRAQELSREVGDPAQFFTVTWGLWLVQQTQMKLGEGRRLADELLGLAEAQSVPAFLLQAHHAIWTTLSCVPELSACRQHARCGLDLYDREQHRGHRFRYGGHDPGVCASNHLALTGWLLGNPDQAADAAREGVAMARELEHGPTLSIALGFAAFTHQFRGEGEVVLRLADELITLCVEQGISPQHHAYGVIMRGWARMLGGDPDGADEMRRGLRKVEATGVSLRRPYLLGVFADACIREGLADEARRSLAEALASEERWWQPELLRIGGDLSLAAATAGEAGRDFARALKVARSHQARSLELRAATSLARLWAEQGERRKAHDLLAPIYGWFTEGFDTKDLKDAKALLDQLA